MILYLFISHNSVITDDYEKIKSMMYDLDYNNYFIVYGGKKKLENDHVIHLDCDDTYCGLPNKIHESFVYIDNISLNYNYIFKLDRTVIINNLIQDTLDKDYYGKIAYPHNGSMWHFHRCETYHKWYNKTFDIKCNYCIGLGYLVSKKSVQYIIQNNDYNNHVFEDYYVGSILNQNNIIPHKIDLTKYIYDPTHQIKPKLKH